MILIEFGGGDKRSLYCKSASRNDRETSVEVVVVQSTKYGYRPISCSHAVRPTADEKHRKRIFNIYERNENIKLDKPLAGGAFFMDTIKVATAFRTNDISDKRYLGSGHLPLCRSSSLNFFRTSWKRCSNAVTASRPATPPSFIVASVFALLLLFRLLLMAVLPLPAPKPIPPPLPQPFEL